MDIILLIVSFAILLFFTLVLKKSLLIAAAVSLAAVIMVTMFNEGITSIRILRAGIHGTIVALEISLLVLGALTFFNYLKSAGFIQNLETSLKTFSTNKLMIVILLAFYFGGFIEGISGFGTPAMIVAPILLGLRFPPYLAASLSLLANTIPVVFGAVGTPIKIGFDDLPITQVPLYTTLLLLTPTLLMPFSFKRLLKYEGFVTKPMETGKLNFVSLMAGIAFAVPFIVISLYSVELPSILGSIIGLLAWLLVVKNVGTSMPRVNSTLIKQLFRSFKPYLLIALLLIVGKILLGSTKFSLLWPSIGLNKSINVFQPGLIFLIGLLCIYLSNSKQGASIRTTFKASIQRLPTTFGCIACLAIIASLLASNLRIEELFATGFIPAAFAPSLAIATGFLGSFIAGSATMSNLMFGAEWYNLGVNAGLNTSLLLACQLAGSAMGNALSVQNIAMVQAVLNESGMESRILQTLWKPVLFFFLLLSLTAFIWGYL